MPSGISPAIRRRAIGIRCSNFCRSSLAPPTDGSSGFGWRTFRQPAPELSFRIWKKLAAAGSPREISVSRRSIPWRDSSVCTARNTWNGAGQIQTIASKKVARPLIGYLEKDELDALLKAPDRRTAQGRRDYAVLLFLYNTGARADEVAQVRIGDLDLGAASSRDASSVVLRGKGNKTRRCPLWPRTVDELRPLIDRRAASQHVFLNRRGQPLTRFGIHALVERYAARVATKLPSVAKKRVSPHTIRHTTATHLLRAGVDINTIRAWLGHVCLSTTNVYAEVDLEMKAKALVKCEIKDGKPKKPWRKNPGLMEFLRTL